MKKHDLLVKSISVIKEFLAFLVLWDSEFFFFSQFFSFLLLRLYNQESKKTSRRQQTENKHGFVTIMIFGKKRNVFNNGTSIHPSQRCVYQSVDSLYKFRLFFFRCLHPGVRQSQWQLYLLSLNP